MFFSCALICVIIMHKESDSYAKEHMINSCGHAAYILPQTSGPGETGKGRNNLQQENDITFKEFWRDNDRFADLFNGTLFQGRPVVDARQLREADTDVSGRIVGKTRKESYKRNRDVVKKLYRGTEFVILGLEDQSHIHYAMPLRSMGYDYFNYTKEYKEICRRNRRENRLRGRSAGEYLSGFLKTDRLHPVFTLVVYYGEEPWDGPYSLKDLMTDLPPELESSFCDYRMNLVQMIKEDPGNFTHPDVSALLDLVQLIYKDDPKGLQKKYSDVEVDKDVFDVVKAITSLDIKVVPGNERGKAKMWTTLKKWQQESYESGKQAGELAGYESGERAGYESGKQAGYLSGERAARAALIGQMLKNHWDVDAIHDATAIPVDEIRAVQRESNLMNG